MQIKLEGNLNPRHHKDPHFRNHCNIFQTKNALSTHQYTKESTTDKVVVTVCMNGGSRRIELRHWWLIYLHDLYTRTVSSLSSWLDNWAGRINSHSDPSSFFPLQGDQRYAGWSRPGLDSVSPQASDHVTGHPTLFDGFVCWTVDLVELCGIGHMLMVFVDFA